MTAFDAITALKARQLAGSLSAKEIATDVITRADALDPTLRAFADRNDTSTIEQAAGLDAKSPDNRGNLAGALVSVKELYDVKGYKVQAGGAPFAPVPGLPGPQSKDSRLVELLRREGAIIVGTTNSPSGGLDWQPSQHPSSRTNNPWDLARTPGGSSAGEAAAIASGMSRLGVGSDMAGSVRIPAAFCGIFSHKPTVTSVSLHGHYPHHQEGHREPHLATPGFFARHPEELRLALEITKECDISNPRHARLADYRLGFVRNDTCCPISGDQQPVIDAFFAKLEGKTATLREGWPDRIQPSAHLQTFWHLLGDSLSFLAQNSDLSALRTAAKDNPELEHLLRVWEAKPGWSDCLEDKQNDYIDRWQNFFDPRDSFDAFIMPVCFTTAFPHISDMAPDLFQTFGKRRIECVDGTRRYLELPFWSSFATVAGLPATTIPIGRTQQGLPVGLQIVGASYEDFTPLHIAQLLSQELDINFAMPRDASRFP